MVLILCPSAHVQPMKCLSVSFFKKIVYTKPTKPPLLLFHSFHFFLHYSGHLCTAALLRKADLKWGFAHCEPLCAGSRGFCSFLTKPVPCSKNENVMKGDWLWTLQFLDWYLICWFFPSSSSTPKLGFSRDKVRIGLSTKFSRFQENFGQWDMEYTGSEVFFSIFFSDWF